jgi:two-component system sensor histidine kinase VicK
MDSSAMLLALAGRSSLLFFCFDLVNVRFTYVNDAFVSFFGLNDNQLQPDTVLSMVHSEDQQHIASTLKALLEGNLFQNVECRIVRGGNERWLRITPFLLVDDGAAIVMGYAEDFTVYRQHDDNLNNHNEKKNAILNILSHDLAGPIGTIYSLSDMLRQETSGFNNAHVTEYIETIKNISKNSIQLIRDFVDREFLETSGVGLMKTRVELVGKFRYVLEEYLNKQEDLGISFFFRANKDAINVTIDEDKFMQVINNLLSNALKFTNGGGSITLSIEESTDHVLLSVADTGIGIPPDHHASLFDKFTPARRSGLHGEPSTGLGMSIIKTIVEWHEGKIWFDSEEGKGTTFYIRLPR